MKIDNKNSQSCLGVDQEIDFNDKAINKLSIKEGNRKDFNFIKNLNKIDKFNSLFSIKLLYVCIKCKIQIITILL